MVFSVFAQGILTGKYINKDTPPIGSRVDTYGHLFPLALSSSERNLRARKLASDYNTGPYREFVLGLSDVALNAGLTLTQMSLAWVLRLPQVSSAVIGTTRIEQLHENVKTKEISLSDDVIHQITAIRSEFLN